MKGNVYAWIVILTMGWVTTMLWIIFTEITIEHLYPWAVDHITDAESLAHLRMQKTYHEIWPMFLMVGLTVYGIVSSAKKEPSDMYQSY